MQKKIIIIALAIAFGIPTVMVGVFWGVWYSSPIFRERVLEAALLSRVYPLQRAAAQELRQYPSEAAALSLVGVLNLLDKSDPKSADIAERSLATLCLMTGQDFGTNFSGTEYNFSWSPPGESAWPEVMNNVNAWSLETFGGEALGSFSISITTEKEDAQEGDSVDGDDSGAGGGEVEQ
ncbi:MAG TPA: hypothetical protein VM658_18490 [bacterium]|nr:hypothetical protein [bacterium]